MHFQCVAALQNAKPTAVSSSQIICWPFLARREQQELAAACIACKPKAWRMLGEKCHDCPERTQTEESLSTDQKRESLMMLKCETDR